MRSAARVSLISVAWGAGVGTAAVILAVSSKSLALAGFGLGTMIDGVASGVLVWRFTAEKRQPDRAEQIERAAHRLIGISLVLVSAYLLVQAIRSLTTTNRIGDAIPGMVIAAVSVAFLSPLAYIKSRLARRLESRALRADSILTMYGAVLASVTLVGIGVARLGGGQNADPIAALLIAALLIREGLVAVRAV